MKTVATQSTVEKGYVALLFAVRELVWPQRFSVDAKLQQYADRDKIYLKNVILMTVATNNCTTKRMNHIDIKFLLVGDKIKKRFISFNVRVPM